MEHRALGASGIEVSALSLGSWRTFERIPREQGVAVMTSAREHGIDFLDDARYDDETGTAPLATGYSEVVFGELFRASGWKRDQVVVANKLWWELWPEQSAAEELEGSLGRMGLDELDLVYAERLPDGLPVEEAVAQVTGLIAAGKARVWGVLNWPADRIAEAARIAASEGVPKPCAAQLAYGLAYPELAESDEMARALDQADASIVASAVLAGGALTGKYADPGAEGRLAGRPSHPVREKAEALGRRLRELARDLDTTPARLAVAFALANPRVASVLFGATRPEQVDDNVQAIELLARLDENDLAAVRDIATAQSAESAA
jgi:aryl-alcohol dehydrogenase-like predicted oxidoreductase